VQFYIVKFHIINIYQNGSFYFDNLHMIGKTLQNVII